MKSDVRDRDHANHRAATATKEVIAVVTGGMIAAGEIVSALGTIREIVVMIEIATAITARTFVIGAV